MDSWIVPVWTLKNEAAFRIGFDFMVLVLPSASVKKMVVSRMQDFCIVSVFRRNTNLKTFAYGTFL